MQGVGSDQRVLGEDFTEMDKLDRARKPGALVHALHGSHALRVNGTC